MTVCASVRLPVSYRTTLQATVYAALHGSCVCLRVRCRSGHALMSEIHQHYESESEYEDVTSQGHPEDNASVQRDAMQIAWLLQFSPRLRTSLPHICGETVFRVAQRLLDGERGAVGSSVQATRGAEHALRGGGGAAAPAGVLPPPPVAHHAFWAALETATGFCQRVSRSGKLQAAQLPGAHASDATTAEPGPMSGRAKTPSRPARAQAGITGLVGEAGERGSPKAQDTSAQDSASTYWMQLFEVRRNA